MKEAFLRAGVVLSLLAIFGTFAVFACAKQTNQPRALLQASHAKRGNYFVPHFEDSELLFSAEIDAAASVSLYLNDICGDTFCAGDYDYRNISLQCGKGLCRLQALLIPYFSDDAPAELLDTGVDLAHLSGESDSVRWSFGSVAQFGQRLGRMAFCDFKKIGVADLFKPEANQLFYQTVAGNCVVELERSLRL